jgi:serine/threonine-protein kinase
MASTRLSPGDTFLDRYEVRRELGRGLTGIVNEVYNPFIRMPYALKLMHEPNDHQVSRLSAEASSVVKLVHENVVRVHDAGQLPDGRGWLLMELLEGSTLAEVLAKQGALSPLLAIHYALGIAWGVAAAHEHGIIHRDLKPANVFVTDGENLAKVLDFSAAKFLNADLRTTKPPDMTGTVAYMAPEQFDGETADGRMDVYALGLIFYEVLAGESPFQRHFKNLHALAVAQAAEMPPRIAAKLGLPACFDEVIQRATRKEAKDRYQTPTAFAQAVLDCKSQLLAAVAAGTCVLEERPGEPSLHDTDSRQEYQAPQPLPRPDTAPVAPAERITIAPAAPKERASAGPTGTLPLSEIRGQAAAAAATGQGHRSTTTTKPPSDVPTDRLPRGGTPIALERDASLPPAPMTAGGEAAGPTGRRATLAPALAAALALSVAAGLALAGVGWRRVASPVAEAASGTEPAGTASASPAPAVVSSIPDPLPSARATADPAPVQPPSAVPVTGATAPARQPPLPRAAAAPVGSPSSRASKVPEPIFSRPDPAPSPAPAPTAKNRLFGSEN